MSIIVIQRQIERFLAGEVPEVLAIKGGWGVGKTYAWNAYLHTAKNQRQVALAHYSYVSLFGVNSLADLKRSIFENMLDRKDIGKRPSVASYRNNRARLLHRVNKKRFALFQQETDMDKSGPALDSLAFLSVEKALICIDDFERKGRGIEAQDILGLITTLKEQKRCKIVLILNDENLAEDSSLEYVRLREKVIDSELRFAPTARDCVAIALRQDALGKLLGEAVVQLQINNIRIIKKTEALARVLVAALKGFDPLLLVRAVRALVLLTWCYYSRSPQVPDYGFVLGRTGTFGRLDEEADLTTQQQGWNATLRSYDNFSLDEFGRQIAYLVENGYLDDDALREQAKLLDEELKAARSENSFQEAWSKFHDSFDDNADEVIACLSDSFRDNARYISPINLDGSVRLLRYLGKNKLATRIIDLYIEKRKGETELFALAPSLEGDEIKDQEIIAKFRKVHSTLKQKWTPEELCQRLLAAESSLVEEESQLSEVSVEDFVQLFSSVRGTVLSRYVDLCLSYNRLAGITEQQQRIADKAIAALQQIGRRSRLNASRVKRFGISL